MTDSVPQNGPERRSEPPAWLQSEADQLSAAIERRDGGAAGEVLERIYDRDPLVGRSVTDYLLAEGLPRLVDQLIADALADTDTDTDEADGAW